jgi:hypothetical protein
MQTNGDDFCGICYIDDIRSVPSVLVQCGHVFHYEVFNTTHTHVLKKESEIFFLIHLYSNIRLNFSQI